MTTQVDIARLASITSASEMAFEYLKLGWMPIPAFNKRPRICFKHITEITQEDVEEWWGHQLPENDIAILTGRRSRLYVLDIDIDKGGFESLEQLEKETGKLDTPLKVQTGSGGMHLYFDYPVDLGVRNAVGIRPGIDVRCEGGIIIAPPSIHPRTGQPYKWIL